MDAVIGTSCTPVSSRSLTEDGWIRLDEHNLALGLRYIEIMCQMNQPTYATPRPLRMARRMARFPCEYFYYPSQDFEVVCGFRWNRRRRRWRWMSVGFVGAITPAAATDLAAWRVHHFVVDKRGQRVYAVQPFEMESPAILELYRLIHQHPAIVLRGTHHAADGTYLRVELPAEGATHGQLSSQSNQ